MLPLTRMWRLVRPGIQTNYLDHPNLCVPWQAAQARQALRSWWAADDDNPSVSPQRALRSSHKHRRAQHLGSWLLHLLRRAFSLSIHVPSTGGFAGIDTANQPPDPSSGQAVCDGATCLGKIRRQTPREHRQLGASHIASLCRPCTSTYDPDFTSSILRHALPHDLAFAI